MSEITIQDLSGVAETLLLPLYNRAMESQRPDAMLKDEKAVELVTQMRLDFSRIRQVPMTELLKVMRIMFTREMDHYSRTQEGVVGNNRRVNWLFGIGVTAGLAVGLAIGRQGRMQRMPRLDAWQRALAEQWGELRAAALASRVLAEYRALYARRPRFARRALQSHLERDILPGLALYQVMLEETGTQEDALIEVGDLFEVAPAKNRSVPTLPAGSSELDCFYLNVLTAYGAPELALAFCSGEISRVEK